jgi:hypothetical protein
MWIFCCFLWDILGCKNLDDGSNKCSQFVGVRSEIQMTELGILGKHANVTGLR